MESTFQAVPVLLFISGASFIIAFCAALGIGFACQWFGWSPFKITIHHTNNFPNVREVVYADGTIHLDPAVTKVEA